VERGLRPDVEALAAIARGSASPGERASAEWMAGRLRDEGAADVELETFRYQGTYAFAHAAHLVVGLVAARRNGAGARAAALAALASLELEASGRAQWLRRILPAGEGVNVVGRVPAAEESRATLVVLAHHDAARTGLAWHPRLVGLGAARARRARRMDPRLGLAAAGLLAAAMPWRLARHAGAAVLAAAVAAELDIASSPTVPGANDNATGAAALLALAGAVAAAPPAHVETLLVAPGCEESGMGGTAAFLRRHRAALQPARTFVLGLDTLGSGTPIVCSAEATLFPHAYRPQDLDLVDAGAARAGVEPPERWRVGAWTDPILARFAGLPAASLLSVGPDGTYPNWHRMTDTPERVDFDSVTRCAAIAVGTAEAFADSVT
jgi:peptidase M28-like protein